MGWKFYSRQATATEVAQLFVREQFQGPRFILGGRVSGTWVGRHFAGTFSLEGGQRVFAITCDENGNWGVAAE
jgi:hypothetical protein